MPSNSRVVAGINNEKILFKVDSLCISRIGGFGIRSHITFTYRKGDLGKVDILVTIKSIVIKYLQLRIT